MLQSFIRGFMLRFYLFMTVYKDNMELPKAKRLKSMYIPWRVSYLLVLTFLLDKIY